jgi:hypothetical protein
MTIQCDDDDDDFVVRWPRRWPMAETLLRMLEEDDIRGASGERRGGGKSTDSGRAVAYLLPT